MSDPSAPVFRLKNLTVSAAGRPLLDGVTLDIPVGGVFGFVGPSGAGKSTLLKSLNRLAELSPGIKVTGEAEFSGESIYGKGTDPDLLRARIGMLFQQPVVFPASILANTLFGLKRLGLVPRRELPEAAERALREAALWDEVKDRLRASALRLSTGQQQRLCLARALACRPEVLLMDEPTSALDPRSTAAIEDLILELKKRHTILLVTHHLPQASRVCDRLALLAGGKLLVSGPAGTVLGSPELRAHLVNEASLEA